LIWARISHPGERVKLVKMGQTCQNETHLGKGSQLENRSHVEKWITLGENFTLEKNRSHLEERDTLVKMVTLVKTITLGKIGRAWRNKGHTCKNGSHIEKWVTLGRKGHP